MHWISSILGPVVWVSAKWEFIKLQWDGVFMFWSFVRDRAISGKVPGMGAGGDACALEHLFRHNPAHSQCSFPMYETAAQFYLCIRLAVAAKILWSLQTSSHFIKFSCQMRTVLSL